MKVKILTTLPEFFPGILGASLIGKALEMGLWHCDVIDIRDFALTRHRRIDDATFGGGNGMVMLPEVLARSIDFAAKDMQNPEIFYMSPVGRLYNQEYAREISTISEIIFICARFEGIDERVIKEYNIRKISIGDYVLSGGDIAAMVVLESALRMLPGVIARQETLLEESFNYTEGWGKLLEYPQYTRPALWRGMKVPEVLLSGNHELIKQWRMEQSIEITTKLRPDLINKTSTNKI
ncbi:MAG: tRNA (guanosine(37)-N1)-methyltransferase TrmD [Alphaproteobacteria bacterium]|nr:tRNA (guanosine(37)-N1)-methyltransferase TrmD [Alphaproteobacteria bacterium]